MQHAERKSASYEEQQRAAHEEREKEKAYQADQALMEALGVEIIDEVDPESQPSS